MLLFWWVGSLATRLLSESLVYSRLETEAASVIASLEFPDIEIDAPRLSDTRLNPAFDAPYSGKYFYIGLNSGGEISSRSMWEQSLTFAELPPGGQYRGRAVGKADEPILYWSGGFSKNGHLFTVNVAEDISPIYEKLHIFQLFFAGITFFLLLSLLVVQHLIVRFSLKKLEGLRGDIHRLEHGQAVALSENVPSEILPLVHEFNRLLLLFDQRLKHSRNSVGNLAHSLKGPLNLLLRAANEESSETFENRRSKLKQNAEQILQLIESELKRARLAGRGSPGRLFDLRAELPPLCGLLKQIYSDKNVAIKVDVQEGVVLPFDRQDMLELVGNLLDNAVKWSASEVEFSVSHSDGVCFVVEDNGPGCSPDQLHRLTERGVRLDESVAGHGLGLSIIKDIVDTYSGTLEITNSKRLGGLCARVYLPATSQSLSQRHSQTPSGEVIAAPQQHAAREIAVEEYEESALDQQQLNARAWRRNRSRGIKRKTSDPNSGGNVPESSGESQRVSSSVTESAES